VADARRFEELTYLDVLARDLNVMDAAAISLARENKLPIIVFNIHAQGAFAAVMRGEGLFTRIVEPNF
jgi:uridylate kinase